MGAPFASNSPSALSAQALRARTLDKKVKCVYVGEVCVCMGDKPFASAVSGKAQPVMEGIQEEYRNRSHKYR